MKGRRLLQQQQPDVASGGTSLAPSMTNTGNALLLELNVPGYEPTTQMCNMLDADLSSCRMMHFVIQIAQGQRASVCDAYAMGTLPTILSDGFQAVLRNRDSNISDSLLTALSVSGCGYHGAGEGGRRLLQYTDLVVVMTHVLVHVVNGKSSFDPAWIQLMEFFQNSTLTPTLLGGRGVIVAPSVPTTAPGNMQNGSYYVNISITFKNVSNATVWNNTLMQLMYRPPPKGSGGSVAFITDGNVNLLTLNDAMAAKTDKPSSSTTLAVVVATSWLNALVAIALANALFCL
jgi:hypothetical protein